MVVTLGNPQCSPLDELEKADDSDRYSLRLDLAPVAAGQFAEIIKRQRLFSAPVVKRSSRATGFGAAPRKQGHFTIVIDPGHGGIDSGASGVSTDVLEKDIVLDIAKIAGFTD